ncbi:signal peptidase I [Brevundimonas alba]|uniref:Signal peptidase I n=1 Tax=Brevundimonas alba TaxID=74314 RepID=A0A7X6BQ61_9CAUL|nr:signal peptidase I [Brevundimonas alba]NJC42261.1 signal peptidase I [Brevundimonas alba]
MIETADTAVQSEPNPARNSAARELFETVRVVALGLLAATVIQTVAWQPFTIPSSSMEPGLVTGDYVVVSKWAYGWSRASLPFNPPLPGGRLLGRSPERGDVVVFRRPSNPQETWVKRLIGLPGDRVQVVGGAVSVNGRVIPRTPLNLTTDHDEPSRQVLRVRESLPGGDSYVTYDGGSGLPGDDTGVYVVPEGFYFMMGDNRDNSLDSRWPADMGVGLLPAENIVGRAEVIVASWKPGAGLFKPWTWLNLQSGRFFKPVR